MLPSRKTQVGMEACLHEADLSLRSYDTSSREPFYARYANTSLSARMRRAQENSIENYRINDKDKDIGESDRVPSTGTGREICAGNIEQEIGEDDEEKQKWKEKKKRGGGGGGGEFSSFASTRQ